MERNEAPNATNTLFQEGVTLAQAGRKQEARRRFRQITNLDSTHTGAWLYLSWLADEVETATKALERVTTLNPTHPSLARAHEWVQQQWPVDTDTLSNTNPTLFLNGLGYRRLRVVSFIGLVLLIGLISAMQSSPNSASSFAADVSSPTISNVAVEMSDLQQSFDLADSASDQRTMIDTLSSMNDLAPTNKAISRQLAQRHYEQGLALRDANDFTKAQAAFKLALNLRPSWNRAQQEVDRVNLFLEGAFEHQNANWAEAIPIFAQLYEEAPDYPNVAEILYSAYFNQGIVQKAQGDLEEALASFQQAAGILPEMPEASDKIAEVTQLLVPPPIPEPVAVVESTLPEPQPEPRDHKRVIVDISEQRTYAYHDDELVFDFIVSTGEPGRDTAIGEYEILDKIPMAYASTWNLDMPFWLGIYWAGPLENGFHAVPTQRSTGITMWEGYLGQRVSYGCIVLSMKDAETLYNWVDVGTPVTVRW